MCIKTQQILSLHDKGHTVAAIRTITRERYDVIRATIKANRQPTEQVRKVVKGVW